MGLGHRKVVPIFTNTITIEDKCFARHSNHAQTQTGDNLEMKALMIVSANQSQSNNAVRECFIIQKIYSNGVC